MEVFMQRNNGNGIKFLGGLGMGKILAPITTMPIMGSKYVFNEAVYNPVSKMPTVMPEPIVSSPVSQAAQPVVVDPLTKNPAANIAAKGMIFSGISYTLMVAALVALWYFLM